MSNAPVEMKLVHMVQQDEHDVFSGMDTIGYKLFPDKESAIKFAIAYNKKHNNQKEVPDYYITMGYVGYEHVTKEVFELHKATAEEIGITQEWDWYSNM